MPNYSKLEKKYKKLKICFTALLVLFITAFAAGGFIVYTNYDYLAFKYLVTSHYIYADSLDSLMEQELKRDIDKKYYSYFDDAVISVITRSIRSLNNDKYTYLYYPEKFKKAIENKKQEAELSEVRFLTSVTAYLKLTNFSKYTHTIFENNLQELKQYPYLIIDLRDNPGGDSLEMNKMAGYFLPKNSVIAIDKLRSKDRVLKSKAKQKLSFKGIWILQNKYTASASENFEAALYENLKNVTLIGETTLGKGVGQLTLPLRRGYAIKLTTLRWLTPNGNNINNTGIKPDIEYSGKDILEYVLNQIPSWL